MEKWKRISIASVSILVLWLASSILRTDSVEAQGNNVVVTSLAQVTGAASALPIASSGTARWIQVSAITGNGAAVFCGGSNVTTNIGIPISAATTYQFPTLPTDSRVSLNQRLYSLPTIYCYAGNNDKYNVTYGN